MLAKVVNGEFVQLTFCVDCADYYYVGEASRKQFRLSVLFPVCPGCLNKRVAGGFEVTELPTEFRALRKKEGR